MRRATTGRVRNSAFEMGHTTRVLMAMQVGESVEIEPITNGALTSARRTARKHMGNADAVWHAQTLDNGLIRLTRQPDGTPRHAKYHNPAVYKLAAMEVGQVETVTTLKGKIHNAIKIHARKIMDNSEAQWRCTNLASGAVRCERVR